MATTMPVHPPVSAPIAPPAGVSITPGDPNYNPIYDPNSPAYGQPGGPVGSANGNAAAAKLAPPAAATPSGPPTYDPANPSAFINYYYNQEYGTDAPPDQIAYWTQKLNSNETTGNGQPATPAYWATRILRQGVDDVNPPKTAGGSTLPLTNGLTNASLLSGMNLGVGPSLVPTDTGAYQTLLDRIKALLGGDTSFSREALLDLGSPSTNASIGSAASAYTPAVQPTKATATTPSTTAPAAPATTAPPAAPAPVDTTNPGNSASPNSYNPGGSPENTALRGFGAPGNTLQEQQWTRPNDPGNWANNNATAIPDWLGNALIAGIAPGAGLAASALGKLTGKLNPTGGIPTDAQGNPDNVGPTDPNLTPERFDSALQARNAATAQQYLNQNEVNGGI